MAKSLEEMKADFLANGGKVKVLPPTATNGMTAKDWKDATSDRGFSPANSSQFQARAAEQFSERQAEVVREAAMMGGQRAAINALNDFNGATRPRRKKRGKVKISKAAQAAQDRYNEEWGVEY